MRHRTTSGPQVRGAAALVLALSEGTVSPHPFRRQLGGSAAEPTSASSLPTRFSLGSLPAVVLAGCVSRDSPASCSLRASPFCGERSCPFASAEQPPLEEGLWFPFGSSFNRVLTERTRGPRGVLALKDSECGDQGLEGGYHPQ